MSDTITFSMKELITVARKWGQPEAKSINNFFLRTVLAVALAGKKKKKLYKDDSINSNIIERLPLQVAFPQFSRSKSAENLLVEFLLGLLLPCSLCRLLLSTLVG